MEKTHYALAVGSLMYAIVCTRTNIAYTMGVVNRYMGNPRRQHWEAVKWILCYLRGTLDVALCFSGSKSGLRGYFDSNMGGDVDCSRSTIGYVFTLYGTAGRWISQLQKAMALSTTKAKYIAIS